MRNSHVEYQWCHTFSAGVWELSWYTPNQWANEITGSRSPFPLHITDQIKSIKFINTFKGHKEEETDLVLMKHILSAAVSRKCSLEKKDIKVDIYLTISHKSIVGSLQRMMVSNSGIVLWYVRSLHNTDERLIILKCHINNDIIEKSTCVVQTSYADNYCVCTRLSWRVLHLFTLITNNHIIVVAIY